MASIRPSVAERSVRLSALAATVSSARCTGEATITGITIDSRDVQPGDLFAALRGSDFDGHAYIEAAIARGAAAVLVEHAVDDAAVPAIIVSDTRRDLAPIAAEFYGHPGDELAVIGLTGTDGKTTTSYLLRSILTQTGHQTGLIGTIGIQIGDGKTHRLPHQTTPESHLVQGYLREMVEAGTTHVVIEATSHGLAMHRLDGTPFTFAGVTNVTHEHLEYHRTLEAYWRAKALLVERVAAAQGSIVLNADDEGSRFLGTFAEEAETGWYSQAEPTADMLAVDVVAGNTVSRFTMRTHEGEWPVEVPMPGEFNVSNSLCALGVARALGVEWPSAIAALREFDGVPGRLQTISAGQSFGVVVDYAHTPAALEKILTLLRRVGGDGRLIVVSGSAGERDPSKRPLQGEVMARLADIAIVTSEDPRNEDPQAIIDDIIAGARTVDPATTGEMMSVVDRREAIARAFSLALPGDTVLLAGKGHEISMIWGFEHRPWDEAAIAREELIRLTETA